MTTIEQLIANAKAWLHRPPPEPLQGYRAYTRAFDKVVRANELDTVLGPMSAATAAGLKDAWAAFQEHLLGWKVRQALIGLEATGRIKGTLGTAALKETAVTLLVDQSGSMRGQRILLAAAAVDAAQDFLVALGASVEILGFTTASWHGGAPRKRWLSAGAPPKPGRLCELLHIVYRDQSGPGSGTGGWDLRPMLRPDLLKENVDGEALLWAAERLRTRPAGRRLLVILSDGAPVDDSTLIANGPEYLVGHLRNVIDELQASPDIELAAVGIAFDVGRYYALHSVIGAPDELGAGLIGLLERALCARPSADAS